MTDGAIACKSCPWPAHVQPFATPNTVETRKESAKLFLSGTHNHRRFSSWGARRRGCYTRHMFTRTHRCWQKRKRKKNARCETIHSRHGRVIAPHKTLGRGECHKKITGFSTSGATCCQVGKLRLGGEITKTCREQRQTEWHWWGRNDTGMRRLQASQSSWPRVIWATTSGAKCIPLRTVVSAQCILSSAGASEQCLKPKGLTQILQNVQKRKSKHAGFNDEMSTVTHDCVTNTGSE